MSPQVTYATPGGVVEDAAWEPVWEAFNEENDDIQANYLAVGGGYGPQYLQLLQARLAAGTGPDVFFVMDGFTVGFARARRARSDRQLCGSKPGCRPGRQLRRSYRGAPLARSALGILPRDGAPYATWFNADIYDEAGLPYPEGLSWEEFVEQAVELTGPR